MPASKMRLIIPSTARRNVMPTGQGCRPWPAQEFRLLHHGVRSIYIFLCQGKEDIISLSYYLGDKNTDYEKCSYIFNVVINIPFA